MTSAACALSEAKAGAVCRVESVDATPEHAARMAGLGVGVGRRLRVVRVGDPIVVKIYGSQVGLARAIAGLIRVSLETAVCSPDTAASETR